MSLSSRFINVNDLSVHILEARPQTPSPDPLPLIVLLHGFPEIAYSWRKILQPLANKGYHVVAPDQRGFGRTTTISNPTKMAYLPSDDLTPFTMPSLAGDILALVHALGYSKCHCVIGHDSGSAVAGFCALLRPDVFERVVCMSAPFVGMKALGLDPDSIASGKAEDEVNPIEKVEKILNTQEKAHYTYYFSGPEANGHLSRGMPNARPGSTLESGGGGEDDTRTNLKRFLRAYYHTKSADWSPNAHSRRLTSWQDLAASMPPYYIMPMGKSMPEALLPFEHADSHEAPWLTNEELEVYVENYTRTGFQGGLNWYRTRVDINRWGARPGKGWNVLAGVKVRVPAMFVAGKCDWGTWQYPGQVDEMAEVFAVKDGGWFHLIEGAGHWVQQERPDEVLAAIMAFLRTYG